MGWGGGGVGRDGVMVVGWDGGGGVVVLGWDGGGGVSIFPM